SLLGLAILALNVMALRARQYRLVCFALLVLTVFLALIGLRSGSLHHPAVVVGNLLGGFTMLGLVGWLVFRIDPGAARYTETRVAPVRANVLVAIVLLAIQIGLGALTSANFAATACEGFPRCNERWYPDATIYQAFRVDEPHEIDDQGYAVGSFERAAIHQAHRLFSVAVLLAIAWTAVSAMFATQASQRLGIAALALVILEMSAGIASVLTGLPTWLAVAHNWLAALLLLVLLKMLAMSREKWWHG
ncbi:MAG: COX15/CtaA family protein, partial [Xanthomonadales bacterium]|nr:COX15/CtaA family protein [Xanthomonadales bacterium]